jgi:hypothetical protein
MTLEELTRELFAHVDEWLRDNYFKSWINDAILKIATEFDSPGAEENRAVQPAGRLNWLAR